MKDFKGNELFIGDKVIFTMKSYGTLIEGTITKITSQVTISHSSTFMGKTYNHSNIIRDSDNILKLG